MEDTEGDAPGYAPERVPLRLRVSETEPLSLRKSAKNRGQNPNSLRSDMRILPPNADSRKLRGSRSPANATGGELFPELVFSGAV